MNIGSGPAWGSIPIVTIFDYVRPEINGPDLFEQQAYQIQRGGGGSPASVQRHKANSSIDRSPFIGLFYTLGLILVSAAIFITLVAWSNVLLSWLDSQYVNPIISSVTTSRLYFATIITIISVIVVTILLLIWYYFTICKGF